MMHPDPSLQPLRGGFLQLTFEALLHQRPVPPRAHREQGISDREIVAVAGDAELEDLADPARDFFALRAALVEVVIARAEDDLGDAGQQREVFLTTTIWARKSTNEPTSSA